MNKQGDYIKEKFIMDFANAKLDSFAFDFDREKALGFLRQEIKKGFEDLNSIEVRSSRCNYFDINGTKPNDFSELIVNIPEYGEVMVGIRHFGGNKDFPFLHVLPSWKVTQDEEVNRIRYKIKEVASVFDPKHFSIGLKNPLICDFIASVTMVGKFKDYKELPRWDSDENFILKKEESMDCYHWYREGYEKFHQQYPELREKVPVNEEDIIEDSYKGGLLYGAYVQGERVGLIAGERGEFLGHPGIYFNEIFLLEKWKGQGLGKSLQKKFILEVGIEGDLIWGTIDQYNIPSMKTAEANGRVPVHYECFFII